MRQWLIFGLVVLMCCLPLQARAARQFNGTDQCLQAASVDLSGVNKVSVAFWLYWDAFANDDDFALEFTANGAGTNGGFLIDPNSNFALPGGFRIALFGNVGLSDAKFTRPSAATWHQYVIEMDMSAGSGSEIAAAYVDGSSQSLTTGTNSNNTGNFANSTLNFMCRNNTGEFGAGRLCEVAVYPGVLLSATQVSALAAAFAPPMVSPTSKPYYWPLMGRTSPEPELFYGKTATVIGATQVVHPRIYKTGTVIVAPPTS